MPKITKTETNTRGAPASYPLRIQAIRTKGQNVRFFVYTEVPAAFSRMNLAQRPAGDGFIACQSQHLPFQKRPCNAIIYFYFALTYDEIM
jgi:hypothetical protein